LSKVRVERAFDNEGKKSCDKKEGMENHDP